MTKESKLIDSFALLLVPDYSHSIVAGGLLEIS